MKEVIPIKTGMTRPNENVSNGQMGRWNTANWEGRSQVPIPKAKSNLKQLKQQKQIRRRWKLSPLKQDAIDYLKKVE